MLAQESLREGNLEATLQALQDEVRANPADVKQRIFLFQLLSVMGDWQRALTQLNVAGDLDASTLMMVQAYREALGCEALRAEVFAGHRTPLVFGDPERWIALAIESVKLSAEGNFAEAQAMRDEAYEEAPGSSGSVNGEPFEWVADADSRIGPFLEALVNGNYYWVPFHRISAIEMEEPTDLRDLVWAPAQFTWSNGGETVGFIPVRYPDSHSSGDPDIALGRRTEWVEKDATTYFGLGQRVLATDGGEYSLLDVRSLTINATAAEADPAQ